MKERRRFLKIAFGCLSVIGLAFSPLYSGIRWAVAQTRKKILPRGTPRESLVEENPASVDPRNLDITPLKAFGTMGLEDQDVNLEKWRLVITGEVKTPLALTYEEIKALPAIERDVLLICPGVFANYGQWKGISVRELLKMANAKPGVTHVTVRGPEGSYESLQRYPIEDILSDKVFLAYQVNGEILPRKHGFPLRAVAEDYYGFDWIKYVYKVTFDKI